MNLKFGKTLLAAAMLSLAVSASADAMHGRDHEREIPRFDHVFIIMMENTGAQNVVGNPQMPMINRLINTFGYADNYYGVTHPSLPNYVAAISGSNWWSQSDDPTQQFNHSNIVDSLNARHISWAAYMQSIPYAGFTGQFSAGGASSALYVLKHDPFMLFKNVYANPREASHVQPLRNLTQALRIGDVAKYVWITPDVCHDMHGMSGSACPYSNTQLLYSQGDAFVGQMVNAIMQSPIWNNGNNVIFITWDEGDYDGNTANGGWANTQGAPDSPILQPGSQVFPQGGVYGGANVPLIVISGMHPYHMVDHQATNHYSMLKTIEESWDLPLLAFTSDDQVSDLASFFAN